MLARLHRVGAAFHDMRRMSKVGRSFESSFTSLRLTWLSETQVVIVYFRDAYRG